MSPQTKNGQDSPSAFQAYTELSRDKPFSFIPEGSCSKEHIKIWAGQFPVARNTEEAEQPLCALSQGLGCQGQLVHQHCRTESQAWRVCKALCGQSQAWGIPACFIRRTLKEKEEMPRLQQPALGQTMSEGGVHPYRSLLSCFPC